MLLTLIREFLGQSLSAFCGKKSRIIAGDVTVGTLGVKIICAHRVSAGLSNDVIFKWHMPICAEICGGTKIYEQKYMLFLGPLPGKNPKHRNIYK